MKHLTLALILFLSFTVSIAQDSSKVSIKDTSTIQVVDSTKQFAKIWNLGLKQTGNFNKRVIIAQFGLNRNRTSVLATLGYSNGIQISDSKLNRSLISLTESAIGLLGASQPLYKMPGIAIGLRYRYQDITNKRSSWYTELSLESTKYYSSETIINDHNGGSKSKVKLTGGGEFGFGIVRGYNFSVKKNLYINFALGYEPKVGSLVGEILETTDDYSGDINSDPSYTKYKLENYHGALVAQLKIEFQW